MQVLTFGSLLAIVALGVWKILLRPKKSGRLPPGPKGMPIIGNLADLPPSGQQEWQHWLKHKDIYGPISSVTTFGTTLIVLNDADIAVDLLEKRATVHSSRPYLAFAGEMCGWDNATGLMPYGPEFRLQRKNLHNLLGGTAVKNFYPVQEAEVRRFLFRVTQSPEDVVQHIRTEAGAIILKMSYGYTVEPHKRDPLIDLADEALQQFSAASVPGTWLVDMLPFLRHMPQWLPGTGFKKTARHWKQTLLDTTNKPYDFVLRQMEAGKYEPSYVSNYVKQNEGNIGPKEETVGRWSALAIYAGGADTTVSTIACFFLAMTYYPSVLKQAQEEIDRVVGNSRLPSFDDRPNLPYIEAVVWECLRWHPIGPLGIAHAASEDDEYNGYLIPKGAIILANIWAFTHDPIRYSSPLTFDPSRFLHPTNPDPDPRKYSFGFGRRVCPGRALADSSVWLTIAQSLASLDIGHLDSVKEGGQDVAFDESLHFSPDFFLPGTISHPKEVRAVIRPRSEVYEDLIKKVEVDFPWAEGDGRKILEEKN